MDNVIASRTLDAKPIAPALFAHFVLRSANMQPMVDWYTTVLNMHVVKRNDFICFLTYDEEHHRLAIVNIAGLHAPDSKSWGLAHVAYTFRNVGEHTELGNVVVPFDQRGYCSKPPHRALI